MFELVVRPWIARVFGDECAYGHLAAASVQAVILSIDGPRDLAGSGGMTHQEAPDGFCEV